MVMFVDELQYVEEGQLAALITALHRAAQRRFPVVLVGAGLPQLRGRMGRAKSYAERLFDFSERVFSRSVRPFEPIGETLFAGDGGTGSRPASLRRHCRTIDALAEASERIDDSQASGVAV